MSLYRSQMILVLAALLAMAPAAWTQRSKTFIPRIGYVYPAGGRQGARAVRASRCSITPAMAYRPNWPTRRRG